MEIIPAIDLIEGKCVRLVKGNYDRKTIYNEDPLEVAKQFEDAGLRRLHLVDLDGARTGKVKNWKILERIARYTNLLVDFGGGINTAADLQKTFNSGAALATIGSLAVKDKAMFVSWLQQYGADNFLLAADVKGTNIAIEGWTQKTNVQLPDFLHTYIDYGVQKVFCTDISKDGKLQGPATSLYKDIKHQFPVLYLIASGGVASIKDLHLLKEAGCSGVIIGKALYENNISLKDLKSFIY